MRVLIGPDHQVEGPFAQMRDGWLDFAVIARQRAINKIEPGILFDPHNFVAAFKAAFVNRTQLWILLKFHKVPITPQGELIFEVKNTLRWKRVALPQRVT